MATTPAIIIAQFVNRSLCNRYKVAVKDLTPELVEYYEYKVSQPTNISKSGIPWVEFSEDGESVFFSTSSVGGDRIEITAKTSSASGNIYAQYDEHETAAERKLMAREFRKARAEARGTREVTNASDAAF